MKDDGLALEIDVALAERARRECWRSVLEGAGHDDRGDWFRSVLLLLMDLV